MAKRKDALKIKELNGGKSKKTEKVEKTNQEVQEQLKEAQEQTAEDVNNFLIGPSEEEDAKRLAELKKAIEELDEKEARLKEEQEKVRAEADAIKKREIDEIAQRAKAKAQADDRAEAVAKAKAKSKAEADAKEAEKSKANKADGAKLKTAAELEAEARRWQKAIEDGEKAFDAKKAKGLAEVERLKAEAKRVAAEEEKARLAAIEAAKAEEARKAAEAKKAEEAAKAEKEAAEAVCVPGPKKIYQYKSSKKVHTTSDIWAAEQAAPGRWKAVWVWVGSNGKVHHVLTPEEIAEYVQ